MNGEAIDVCGTGGGTDSRIGQHRGRFFFLDNRQFVTETRDRRQWNRDQTSSISTVLASSGRSRSPPQFPMCSHPRQQAGVAVALDVRRPHQGGTALEQLQAASGAAKRCRRD